MRKLEFVASRGWKGQRVCGN